MPLPYFPFPFRPIRNRAPQTQLGGLGSAVISPSGVGGEEMFISRIGQCDFRHFDLFAHDSD